MYKFSIFHLADAHRTVLHGVELKKTSLQKLKKELENIERETESKLLEIDKNNAELEVSPKSRKLIVGIELTKYEFIVFAWICAVSTSYCNFGKCMKN